MKEQGKKRAKVENKEGTDERDEKEQTNDRIALTEGRPDIFTGPEVPQLPPRGQSTRGYQNVEPKRSSGLGYENTPPKEAAKAPPPLPPGVTKTGGYENTPPKGSTDTSPRPSTGYVNTPPKGAAHSPPPLPPRVTKAGGYENIPEKGASQAAHVLPPRTGPHNYQNMPPKSKNLKKSQTGLF